MAIVCLYLGGLLVVLCIGEDMAAVALVNLGGLGTVVVVSVVRLALVVSLPCSWVVHWYL
jgi:hypothetical protein